MKGRYESDKPLTPGTFTNGAYMAKGNGMSEDTRSAIVRCLSSDLYEDAGIDEVAEACEVSPLLVQKVLDDMRLRRLLVHARLVSEQLGLGMDESPEAVITWALERAAAGRAESEGLAAEARRSALGPGPRPRLRFEVAGPLSEDG